MSNVPAAPPSPQPPDQPPSTGDVEDALQALTMVKQLRELDGLTEHLERGHDSIEARSADTRRAMRAQLDAMIDDEDAAQGRLDQGTEALTDALTEIKDLQCQLAALKDLSTAQEEYIARAEEEELEARTETQDELGKMKRLAAEAAASTATGTEGVVVAVPTQGEDGGGRGAGTESKYDKVTGT
mmetsp:Transcript_40918/g.65590  ORF Transcript_40918/g.65590 Transcript_40918/m.65590 type:complete len:185 (-) Transcript_40918:314-868(-)|eukprot:CAMPEP_0198682140 /NCGR_PEP_ID=MMETSP1468-20131203/8166_1 /TAXON_ID=1461545 /ORGANISM="Mantoniella sp, Strain CCMP1436" /LENGTH=184 /DNA_ID=CAMNT_0044424743 /DNA_START=53 /DNA_END=607 /DNA_ORIENTATION=-